MMLTLQFPFRPLKSTLSHRVALFVSAKVTDKPLPSYSHSQVQSPLNSRHSTECRSSPWEMDPYWALDVTNTLSWYNGICWPCLDSIYRFPLGLPVAFFQRQFLLPKWRMKYPSSKISISHAGKNLFSAEQLERVSTHEFLWAKSNFLEWFSAINVFVVSILLLFCPEKNWWWVREIVAISLSKLQAP